MHGIYSYAPETNHVYRVQNVAAILYLTVCAVSHTECSVFLH